MFPVEGKRVESLCCFHFGIEKIGDSPRPFGSQSTKSKPPIWQVLKLTDQEILNLYHFAQSEVVTEKGWVGFPTQAFLVFIFLISKIFRGTKTSGKI